MYSLQTDRTISIIQRKWSKLRETDNQQLYRHFRRLWEFIRSNSICNEILNELVARYQRYDLNQDATNIFNGQWIYFRNSYGGEERDVAASVRLMDMLIEDGRTEDDMRRIAQSYVGVDGQSRQYYLNQFYSLFLSPILEYVQDHLEENILILNSLLKFKHRCEWFDRTEMFRAYEADTGNGERSLKRFLFKYLFDQGISIVVEPSSPSGETDFLTQESCGEVKIFHQVSDRTRIIDAIQTQLLTYLNRHNEPVGYMVIFKTNNTNLVFNLDVEQQVYYIDFGAKRIYILVIDISINNTPVSCRRERQTITISRDDFISILTE